MTYVADDPDPAYISTFHYREFIFRLPSRQSIESPHRPAIGCAECNVDHPYPIAFDSQVLIADDVTVAADCTTTGDCRGFRQSADICSSANIYNMNADYVAIQDNYALGQSSCWYAVKYLFLSTYLRGCCQHKQ